MDNVEQRDRGRSLRTLALGASVTAVTVLPVLLTGAMAVQIRQELAFDLAALGVAVAGHRFAGMLLSPFLGPLADRLGARRSLRLAALTSAVSAFGIALTVSRWSHLVAWLFLSGATHALGSPAANRLLSGRIPTVRLGTAFGIKQAAPPVAGTISGLSVPLIALTVGWRWGYVLCGVLAIVCAVATGRAQGPRPARSPSLGSLGGRGLRFALAGAFGLATMAASGVSTYYVASANEAGLSSDVAGLALALGSVTAIVSRVLAGLACDRIPRGHLRLCAGLVAAGAAGVALLMTGHPGAMAVGACLALGGTWGFNGAFWYAVVRAYPGAPGAVSGAIAPGGLLGATTGPLIYGAAAQWFGHSIAWGILGASALASSVLLWRCATLIEAARPTAQGPRT